MSVLIIDESSFGLKLIDDICRAHGVGSIFLARTTERGLSLLDAGTVNAVICDWSSAPNDGLTLARRIRAHKDEQTKKTPIILVKANPTPADVAAAREAGATEFLARPFSAAALTTHLKVIFGKPRQFVSAPTYAGPDRRRRPDEPTNNRQRRQIDAAAVAPKA